MRGPFRSWSRTYWPVGAPWWEGTARRDSNDHCRTTVTFDNNTGTAGGNHAIGGNYTNAADALDKSTDPSVQRYRDSMGAFTGGKPYSQKQIELDDPAALEKKYGPRPKQK